MKLFKKRLKRIYKCSCGGKIIVITKAYDNLDSGTGTCEFGAKIVVN